MAEKVSYEQAREELTKVVEQLEAGSATLEDSLKLWERGEELAKICQDLLDGAKKKVSKDAI
ncbi:MAG: exodeoxyribonuclease VII small subunit [Candidatus Nanopelagicaceae bacterium]|jgi:exodeoxyribonuclease VII small subunit